MNKKYIYASIIAVVVIIALILYFNKSDKDDSSKQTPTEQQTNDVNTNPEQTTTSTPEQTTTTPPKKLNYGEAIKAYPSRYQFINCSANPGQMTVKKGTAVMLDNRDKVAHTIKANGQSVKIAALDYAVIYPKLVTIGEPTTASPNMTCDGGGSGLLNVEK